MIRKKRKQAGRPPGSRNKPKFSWVSLRELNAKFQPDAVVPISLDFVQVNALSPQEPDKEMFTKMLYRSTHPKTTSHQIEVEEIDFSK